MNTLRTFLADDEPLAREGLRLLLAEHPHLAIVGEASDGFEATEGIRRLKPDLVFLDVQMPGLDGFSVLEDVASIHLPIVIFVTAYDAYAVRAFEVHAVDYLLKPVQAVRLRDALSRARHALLKPEREVAARHLGPLLDDVFCERAGPARAPVRRLAVRHGERFVLVKTEEIDWVEAASNYVEIHVRDRVLLHRATLSALTKELDPERFARIHRSTLVNVDRVLEIRPDPHGDFEIVLSGGKRLRMSRSYRSALLP